MQLSPSHLVHAPDTTSASWCSVPCAILSAPHMQNSSIYSKEVLLFSTFLQAIDCLPVSTQTRDLQLEVWLTKQLEMHLFNFHGGNRISKTCFWLQILDQLRLSLSWLNSSSCSIKLQNKGVQGPTFGKWDGICFTIVKFHLLMCWKFYGPLLLVVLCYCE